ncbi:MAG: cell wall-binding repeat-containing protein, partial [Ruminococcus sp.]|nr:cell wall-binding repeat-containing protein [Ruminococcus sp.]
VYAAINKAPLFLVNGKLNTPKLTDDQKAFLKTKAASKITVFGGTGAVSDEFVKLIANAGV